MSWRGAVEPTDPRAAVGRAWWDYVAIVGCQGIGTALSLVGLSLVARLLGPERYGTVALVLSIVQLLYVIGVNWTMAATVRFGRERLVRPGAAGPFFWSWLPIAGVSFLIAGLAAATAMPLVRRFSGLAVGSEAVFFLLFSAITLARCVEHLLQMAGRMRVYAAALPVGKLVYVIALAALAAITGSGVGVTGVLLVMTAALAVQIAVGLPFVGSRVFLPVRWDAALSRRIVNYSSPLLLTFSFGYVSDWMDHYVLRMFRTTAEIGVYHLAYQAMLFLSGTLAGVATLAFPILTSWRAEGSDERCRRYLSRLVPQASVLWSLVVPPVGVGAAAMFPVLFGPGFEVGARYLAVLSTGVVFLVVTYLYSPVFSSYDILGRATWVQAGMVVVNLGSDLSLVPALGPIGAAIGTAVSYALGAVLYLALGNRRLNLRHTAALVPPVLALAPLVAIAAGLGLLFQLLLVALSTVAILAWAKQHRVFERADLGMFSHVQLPGFLRSGVTRAYEALS